MDSNSQDIASLQDKIRLLNDYGVHVMFTGSNNEANCSTANVNPVMSNIQTETGKMNVSNCGTDLLQINPAVNASVLTNSEAAKIAQNNVNISHSSTASFKPVSREFQFKSGLNICLSDTKPIDYFRLMADEKMFQHLLEETNKNLRDMREENGYENTQDVTLYELIRFVGLLFHMGTIQLNRIVDYWSDDPLFNFSCFSRYMSRNRFMILLKCLQFNNLVEHFNLTMSKCYTAGKQLAVKEPLYFIDGRLRKKPVGLTSDNYMTLHCVTEPNGVTLNCAVSILKSNENIILNLLSELSLSNRSVFVAQCYSSVRLAHKLLGSSITCTGFLPNDTLRLANMVQEKPLIGIVQKGCLIGRWKRDNSVYFSSEYNEIENIDEASTPTAVSEYNRIMKDDKLNDELLSYYTCERRLMCADKKILIHLLQIILMNAYYLYNSENEHRKTTLYDFRLDIIRSLVEPDLTKWTTNRDLPVNHQPCLLRQDSLGRPRRKKCSVCFHDNGIRQDTQYYCPRCPNLPGLCLDSCFKTYHNLNNDRSV